MLHCALRIEASVDCLVALGDVLTCGGASWVRLGTAVAAGHRIEGEGDCHEGRQGGVGIGLAGAWSLEGTALCCCAGPSPGSGVGLRLEGLLY
ncbi:hypothetical protein NDU88_007835 [Pleurodeles waltl]|uniref:Uncharacterized protein n=1 Tax=Pleurodeles waltl TaxID=8319 RepID=A0AAV7N5E3_PLEWA|nr:hypothetical protein NDU88_007835 [Pleurodeles waltl]